MTTRLTALEEILHRDSSAKFLAGKEGVTSGGGSNIVKLLPMLEMECSDSDAPYHGFRKCGHSIRVPLKLEQPVCKVARLNEGSHACIAGRFSVTAISSKQTYKYLHVDHELFECGSHGYKEALLHVQPREFAQTEGRDQIRCGEEVLVRVPVLALVLA